MVRHLLLAMVLMMLAMIASFIALVSAKESEAEAPAPASGSTHVVLCAAVVLSSVIASVVAFIG